MGKEIRNDEPVTKDNIGQLMHETFEGLLSAYKRGLLENLDELEKMRASSPPKVISKLTKATIYRLALDDVRQLIKGG